MLWLDANRSHKGFCAMHTVPGTQLTVHTHTWSGLADVPQRSLSLAESFIPWESCCLDSNGVSAWALLTVQIRTLCGPELSASHKDLQKPWSEKLEKAGTVDFKKHPARKVGTRSRQCGPKVPGRFAFPGARNPSICSIWRFGKIFPAILPEFSWSFPQEPPNRPRKQPQPSRVFWLGHLQNRKTLNSRKEKNNCKKVGESYFFANVWSIFRILCLVLSYFLEFGVFLFCRWPRLL